MRLEINNPKIITEEYVNEILNGHKNVELVFKNIVNDILYKAFYSDDRLKSVTFNEYVSRINSTSFCCCNNLESVVFKENCSVIDVAAFKDCHNLKSLSYKNIDIVAESAFENCALESLDINKIRNVIHSFAFANNKLKSFHFHNKTLCISKQSFAYNEFSTIDIDVPDENRRAFRFFSDTDIFEGNKCEVRNIHFSAKACCFEAFGNLSCINFFLDLKRLESFYMILDKNSLDVKNIFINTNQNKQLNPISFWKTGVEYPFQNFLRIYDGKIHCLEAKVPSDLPLSKQNEIFKTVSEQINNLYFSKSR